MTLKSLIRHPMARAVALVIAAEGLLLIPSMFFTHYLDSPIGLLLVAPFLSAYLLQGLGVPGLIQHNGACGWGWCAPSLAGWVVIVAVWALGVWVLAWFLAQCLPTKAADDADSHNE